MGMRDTFLPLSLPEGQVTWGRLSGWLPPAVLLQPLPPTFLLGEGAGFPSLQSMGAQWARLPETASGDIVMMMASQSPCPVPPLYHSYWILPAALCREVTPSPFLSRKASPERASNLPKFT